MNGWSRRRALQGLGSSALLASLAGPATMSGRALAMGAGWGKYKGQTVRVCWPRQAHFELAKALLGDFTSATGIKVDLDVREPRELKAVAAAELALPIGEYDLVAYDVVWKAEFARRGWLNDLGPLFRNVDLAMPGYELADIIKGYFDGIGVTGGRRGYLAGPGARMIGVPFEAQASVLAYRGDVLEKHAIAVPKTYDELSAAVAVLRTREPTLGGVAMRTRAGADATTGWLMHLKPYGGSVIDDAFLPRLTDPPAVAATEIFKQLAVAGPAGWGDFDAAGTATAFLEGKAAMVLDSMSILGPASAPERTRLSARFGFAPHPKATAASGAMWGWGLGIPANATRKDSAFVLLQWLTAKPQDVRLTARGGLPIRLSSLEHQDVKARYPVDILRECIRIANPDWRPVIEEWPEIAERIIGPRLAEILSGRRDTMAALTEASNDIKGLCERAGYYRT